MRNWGWQAGFAVGVGLVLDYLTFGGGRTAETSLIVIITFSIEPTPALWGARRVIFEADGVCRGDRLIVWLTQCKGILSEVRKLNGLDFNVLKHVFRRIIIAKNLYFCQWKLKT